jgi:hypothetical protein
MISDHGLIALSLDSEYDLKILLKIIFIAEITTKDPGP